MSKTASGKMMSRQLALGVVVLAIGLSSCGGASGDQGVATLAQTSAPVQESATSGPSSDLSVAESDGLRAEVTSPASVQLSWSPVEGSNRYEIEGSVDGEEFFPLGATTADVTSFDAFPLPDDTAITFRLAAVGGSGALGSRTVSIATPVEVPNPYSVEVTLEETQISIPGFDPSNFDPSTFDPSTLDPSLFDPENFDPSNFAPKPATVTEEIGPEGGSLEVTSANGTTYTLTFPAGAMPFALDVSMTPVASLGGLPPDVEFLGAVQIEPEGVELNAPALLTIQWPDPLQESQDPVLVGIGFGTGGDDFHFLPLSTGGGLASALESPTKLARPTAIGHGGLSMSQLQSQGVAKATRAAISHHTRSNPPADRSRSTRQRAAAQDSAPAQSGPNDELAPLVPPFESWLGENILKRAQDNVNGPAGNDTFGNLSEAISDLQILMENWGDELGESFKDKIFNAVLEALHARLKEAAEAACMSDAHMLGIRLAERLANPVSAFDHELLRRFTAKYGSEGADLIRRASELAERCPLFLWVRSGIVYTSEDSALVENIKIESVIPLNWRYSRKDHKPYLTGTGDINYQEFSMVIDGCMARPNTKVGSHLVVLHLAPTFKSDGTLDNFLLDRYKGTGKANEILVSGGSEECTGGKGSTSYGQGDFWWTDYGGYMLLRGFEIKDWQVRTEAGMSTIAEKTVEHNGNTIDLGTLDGSTKFTLVNERPQ